MNLSSSHTWSPEKAYAVGLLTTDGNLSKDGRHITMSSSDIDLLETFNRCLSLNAKISETKNNGYAVKPHYKVQFSNVQLYRWLLEIGLFPNKTHTLNKINIPNSYFRDFLRGHLDGDGSIFMYNDKYNNYHGRSYTHLRVYLKFISASQQHIEWLQKKINKHTGANGAISHTTSKLKNHVPIWTIKYSKSETVKLLTWMYYVASVPCLARKKKIVDNVLHLVSDIKKKYTKKY